MTAEFAAGAEPIGALAKNASREANTIRVEALVGELVPNLLGYFVNRLDNREDAADAVADTLLALWRKVRSIPEDPEQARRYSFGIARRVLLAHRRGLRKRNTLADRLRAVTREVIATEQIFDLELRDALSQLSEKDREIVLLVSWDGFSVADAGRIIGVTADAARARYSRARLRLRKTLSQTD